MLISNIGELIEKSGLKNKYIAQQLNVTQNTISLWKKGASFPNAERMFKLAKILGCKVDDLYEYKE